MNVFKTNRKVLNKLFSVLTRNYGKPLNVLNPLLAPGHLNAVSLEETDPLGSTVPKPKVIIIGAGIAGLSAANHLESYGIKDYVILEAKDRVGGRIHTALLCNRNVDLGAEWILGAGLKNSVSQLASEEGIFKSPPVAKPSCEQAYFTTDGRVIDPHIGLLGCTAFRDIERCARKVFASNDPSCFGDLQTFFSIRIQQLLHGFPKEYQYDIERVMFGRANHLRYFMGGSLVDIDTRMYGSRDFLSGVKQRVPNGFKRILNPLLEDIPSNNIYSKKPVQKICSHAAERGCPRVTVVCCDGDEFKADYVICTIPLATLKLDAPTLFDPPLPEKKLTAFSTVKNGYCNKVFLEYSCPFWVQGHGTIMLAWSPEELENRDDWTKGISFFDEVPGSNDILCCYIGGREAYIMEQCSLQDVAEGITFTLRKFCGDSSVPYPSRIMRSTWTSDVFSGASTYYLSADSHMKQFEILASPHGPDANTPAVLFAGDGFRADYLGTAHGARSSGIDAANQLIKLQKELYGQTSAGEELCGSTDKKSSVQEDTAKKIKNYTKCLYDYTKKIEEADHVDGGDALSELITENFDDEQIWQQIELQNEARLKALVSDIASVVARKDRLCNEEKSVPSAPLKKTTNGFADSGGDEEQEEEIEDEENEDEDFGDVTGDVGDDDEDEDDSEIEERLKSILSQKEQSLRDQGEFDSDDEDDEVEDLFVDKPSNKKTRSVKIVPSQVDDQFFKLSEMKNYLELMEREDGPEDDELIDLMKSMSSEEESDDNDDEESSGKNAIKFSDFFDAPIGEPGSSKSAVSKVKKTEVEDVDEGSDEEDDEGSDDDDDTAEDRLGGDSGNDDEGEDAEGPGKAVRFKELLGDDESDGNSESDTDKKKSKIKSSFEMRQERLNAKIKHLEDELVADKPWQLKGEVSAKARPENALLEEDLEFDQMTREAPIITEKTSMRLEDIIKLRIKDKSWDDVERKVRPVETASEFKKKLVLDQEKSKLSLAQIYEQEYLNKVTEATPNAEEKTEEIPKEHQEITAMLNSLFRKLDALSNFHFTPKMINPEAKIITNVPAIQMEEVAPIATSDATLLAPEEVKQKPRGDVVSKEERTETDKKRERRQKKVRQRVHAREKEKRENAVAKLKPGLGNKYSKEKAIKDIERISKDANVDLIDGTSGKPATKSSTAFFTQLQDQVKSQIKQKTQPAKRSKPAHQMSAKRIKL